MNLRNRGSGWLLSAAALVCAGVNWSCQQPDYRSDVRPNGEGGIEFHRVPLDDAPTTAPQPGIPSDFAPPPVESKQEIQGEIDDLQAQDIAIRGRIDRLERKMNATTQQ